jgi:hypothetical protein
MSIILFVIVGIVILRVLSLAISIGMKVLWLSIIVAAIVFVLSFIGRSIGKM